jgi:uroporphyrinogen-III synthase
MTRVVITRDAADAAPYAAAFATLGLVAVALPVTQSAPPLDAAGLDRALVEPASYAAIIVASARAADALVAALARRASPVVLPELWAVGPATARALAAGGLVAHQPDTGHDAEHLAAALLAARDLAGARVLVPRAEHGRDEAITALRAAGVIVDDVVAYRTVPIAPEDPAVAAGLAALRAGDVALVAVFAPSQVAALAALLAAAGASLAAAAAYVAIGDTTAAALRAAGVPAAAIATAAVPTPEGMAAAAAAVYPTRR